MIIDNRGVKMLGTIMGVENNIVHLKLALDLSKQEV